MSTVYVQGRCNVLTQGVARIPKVFTAWVEVQYITNDVQTKLDCMSKSFIRDSLYTVEPSESQKSLLLEDNKPIVRMSNFFDLYSTKNGSV